MGEVLADRYTLKIGSTAPAGQYQLAVGLYDPQTEERLAVFGPDGQRLEQDYALLRSVEVEN
jgi:hypothetical protein